VRTLLAAVTAFSWLAGQALGQGSTVRPLRIEDALAQRALVPGSSVALSPDGALVASAVSRAHSLGDSTWVSYTPSGAPSFIGVGGRSDLAVTDMRTGETLLVSDQGANWSPAWSPDGRALAFCSTRDGMARLWVWNRPARVLRRASEVVVLLQPANEQGQVLRWLPDSRHIVIKLLPEGTTVPQIVDAAASADTATQTARDRPRAQRTPTVAVYESGAAFPARNGVPPVDTNAIQIDRTAKILVGDLAVVDVANGAVRRLAHQVHPMWYQPSPDGRTIAFTEHLGLRGGNNWRLMFDLYVVSTSDSTPPRRLVTGLQQLGGTVSWSPDSRSLAYTQFGVGAPNDVYLVADTGGQPRDISQGAHASFNDVDNPTRRPLWASDGKALYLLAADTLWAVDIASGTTRAVATVPGRQLKGIVTTSQGRFWSPDGGRSLYVMTRDPETERMGTAQVDLPSGRILRQADDAANITDPGLINVEEAARGSNFVYVAEDAAHPPDIWVRDTTLGVARRLSHLNPQFDTYRMGTSRIITWYGVDGQLLHGAVFVPPDYDHRRRYPTIVVVYGGAMMSQEANHFGADLYFVQQLMATRGYVTFWPDAPQGSTTPMADLAKTVLPGVNRLIELGIADSSRLAVMGQSYGGYTTFALLVQTTRFRAAVTTAGFGNLLTVYGLMLPTGEAAGIGIIEDGQGDMHATPWERRDRYIENSPYFYLDRIHTPVLLMDGTADASGLWPSNSDQLFVGLRRLGKEAVYLKYPGEGHFLRQYEHQIDYWGRLLAFLEAHLSDTDSTAATRCPSHVQISGARDAHDACPSNAASAP
jgi:dipeptidyl aminopeptidase/acylaminoacyl peptidase